VQLKIRKTKPTWKGGFHENISIRMTSGKEHSWTPNRTEGTRAKNEQDVIIKQKSMKLTR
jgi:hypothetical protein